MLATGDASLLKALDDYRRYHRLDMEIRKLFERQPSPAAGKKRPRSEAELLESMESSKQGYSTYRTRYERGMTEEDRRQILFDGDVEEVMRLLAAYEDYAAYERDAKELRKVRKGGGGRTGQADEVSSSASLGHFSAVRYIHNSP